MQGKAFLSGAGFTTLLTSNPFQTSHAKCPMHAGNDISWRFAQPVPKARLGRQQGPEVSLKGFLSQTAQE